MRVTFSISRPYLHTILQKTINSISPVLYDYYVNNLQDRLGDDDEDKKQAFPDAKFVIDVTFQPIWTPTGVYDEKKQYYSGKHKMYGLKSQCIHDRKGRVVHCVAGELGSIHDLTICRDNLEEVKEVIRKEDEEDAYWFIIADLGYQGLQEYTNAILPHKKKPDKQLTRQQQKYNRELGAERVICERYYDCWHKLVEKCNNLPHISAFFYGFKQ